MSIARRIDHTNLKADASIEDIGQLCDEAMDFGFRAVCVNSRYTTLAKRRLSGSTVAVVTVIDFPLGVMTALSKLNAIRIAVESDTDELDIVWSTADFQSGVYCDVLIDLNSFVAQAGNIPVKIIVETCFLDPSEFNKAYDLVKEAGADYIKTSTGTFLQDEKAYNAVKCWAKKDGLLIKASGGIRDLSRAEEFVTAGADVLGTSSGVKIIRQEKEASHV